MKYSQICPYKTCPFCKGKLKRMSQQMMEGDVELAFYCKECSKDKFDGGQYVSLWYRPGSGEQLFTFMRIQGYLVMVDFSENVTKISQGDYILGLASAIDFDFSSQETIQNKIKFLLTFQ